MFSLTSLLLRWGAVLLACATGIRAASVDVVIYGATPGGIAAATA